MQLQQTSPFVTQLFNNHCQPANGRAIIRYGKNDSANIWRFPSRLSSIIRCKPSDCSARETRDDFARSHANSLLLLLNLQLTLWLYSNVNCSNRFHTPRSHLFIFLVRFYWEVSNFVFVCAHACASYKAVHLANGVDISMNYGKREWFT